MLAEIAPHLPELKRMESMKKAFEAASKIADEGMRAKTLLKIAPNLPESLLKEALEMIARFRDTHIKAEALAGIAPTLEEPEKIKSLKKALEVAKEIGDYHLRSEMLALIVRPLAKLSPSMIYPAWNETHHILARRTRKDLLLDLSALTPIILVLGGPEALKESVCAIEDVSRWWP